MSTWALKTPSGKLLPESVSCDRSVPWEWCPVSASNLTWPQYVRACRRAGYRVVRVSITETT